MTKAWKLFPGEPPLPWALPFIKSCSHFQLSGLQPLRGCLSLPLMTGGPGAEAKNPEHVRIAHTQHCVPPSPITSPAGQPHPQMASLHGH